MVCKHGLDKDCKECHADVLPLPLFGDERCMMYPEQRCVQDRCGFAGAVMDCAKAKEARSE
jgi:hypothetical protein